MTKIPTEIYVHKHILWVQDDGASRRGHGLLVMAKERVKGAKASLHLCISRGQRYGAVEFRSCPSKIQKSECTYGPKDRVRFA
jgi:hypothetical protein